MSDCCERAPVARGQAAPDGAQLVADLAHGALVGGLPRLLGRGRFAGCELPDGVREEHRALRVALGEREQGFECVADVAPGLLEASSDVVRDRFRWEWWQRDGGGLTVEGAAAVGEQLAHHADVRAGKETSTPAGRGPPPARKVGRSMRLAPANQIELLADGYFGRSTWLGRGEVTPP
jgi:hypothetical protein